MLLKELLQKKLLLFIGGLMAGGLLLFVFILQHGWSIDCNGSNQYIDPKISCNQSFVVSKKEYTALKQALETFIEHEKAAKVVDEVSIFFRDLADGPTMGIDQNEKFIPFSLFKLPIMIAYFKYAEENPDILRRMISYEGEFSNTQLLPEEKTIRSRTPYMVRELIEKMIIYSDNNSKNLLQTDLTHLSEVKEENILLTTYGELGLLPVKPTGNEIITTKNYAATFRMLYTASYLSKTMSEKALALLAKSDFKAGLVAGVPKDIPVAHKFGEASLEELQQKQLHDCGIVYFPENPYVLCIMTRGKDFGTLANTIKTISQMFYEELESRKL